MESKKQNYLTRLIVAALFAAVMGGSWDTWWHVSVGRESFWIPPHLILYTGVLVALLGAFYCWFKTKDKVWRSLSLILFLIPLSGPFDELWHRLFGVENLSSPIILWSPPHLLLIGAIMGSLIMLFPLIRRDENIEARNFFINLAFGTFLAISYILIIPFYPIGPYHVIGFWGAGVLSAIPILVLLISKNYIPAFGNAFLITVFFLLIQMVAFGHKEVSWIQIASHDHTPSGIVVFSLLVPALVIDLTRRLPLWLRGVLAGFLLGIITYGSSSWFFAPQFKYSIGEAAIAVFSSALGGWLAGLFVVRFKRDVSHAITD